MKFNYLILFLLLVSCTSTTSLNNKKAYSSKGFAYIYNENDYNDKVVNKRYNNFENIIAHNNLKPGTLIKLTNPENNMTISIEVKNRVNYPEFYKILITESVANELKLNKNIPFIEVEELKKINPLLQVKQRLLMKKKVFTKAPIQNVKIDDISKKMSKPKKKKSKIFKIVLGEFYLKDSAIILKNRLMDKIPDFNEKKLMITKVSKNNYHLTSGPYRAINTLKEDYLKLKKFGFEELDINFMNKLIKILFLVNLLIFNKVIANPNINIKTGILMDYHSDEVLFEIDSDLEIYPASMTKIMTSIIAFDLLKSGKLSMTDTFTISENAWRMSQAGYSSMFIMVNDEVSVEDLLKGIIIASGNDACIALAEGIAGSEENFMDMMNEKAAEIGLTSTNFSNSSGINDPDNFSTVKDIAIMSKYLIKNYPELYKLCRKRIYMGSNRRGSNYSR